ncbi:dienelactone hydrolase family protein [Sphingomonas endolithica]|uniref:dienelactone hydrolase family protein n=1 Tax=Sphingomonas endolithica TaxID=2972485 RepID=UPI0021AED800|nr:dienelactone hydrolase family protein [Sphingomonas sp. ZFBP2030]
MGDHIEITTKDGAFAAYRAVPAALPAPAVVVLHEVFGVNADIRQTCDDLAAHGVIAIAPDLFWRQKPGVDLDVRSEADWNTGLALYQAYDRDLGVDDVAATVRAAAVINGATGKVGVLGYCLGGLMTFLAAARSHVDAAVAFHGADTEKYLGEAPSITVPMLVHLAGEDEFMPEPARAAITAALATHANVQVFTYAGCHHAFSRHNGAHNDAKAAALANQRTWSFLTAMLRTAP